jgi:hypothetical protein
MRVHTLDYNPDNIDQFVAMLADGCTNQQIADTFGVSKRSIPEWRKRKDVQEKLHATIRERAGRILSQTDSKLMGILTGPSGDKLSVDQLLKIREAFRLEGAPEDPAKAGVEAMQQLMDMAAEDPELAEALQKVLPNDSA